MKKTSIFFSIMTLSALVALSVSGNDNRGTNSGRLIRSRHPHYGFRPVSHLRQNISVRNRVRITYRSKPGHVSTFRVFCRKNGRQVFPKNLQHFGDRVKFMNHYKSGEFVLDIYFPAAGLYTVQILGRKGTGSHDRLLFQYTVTARAGFDLRNIPPQHNACFELDGLRLLNNKRSRITARRELTISLNVPRNIRIWSRLQQGSKSYYKPWKSVRVDTNGVTHITLRFPKRGQYTLDIDGENRLAKDSARSYLRYVIHCTEIYRKGSMPVTLYKHFHRLGFSTSGLSHKNYHLRAGRFVRVVLRGKPGLELTSWLEKRSSLGRGKHYDKAPRTFVLPIGNEYHAYAYIPSSGTYNFSIHTSTASSRPYIVKYKVTASGGYSERELDKKLGLYWSEEQYKAQSKNYGSAGKLHWVTDMAEAERISRTGNRILMIVHVGSWCGWSKKFANQTLRHPDVVRYGRKHFVAVKVGLGGIANVGIYNKKYYKYARPVPAATFVAPDGTVLFTYHGYTGGYWYSKTMKAAVAQKNGILTRYIRYHKQGLTRYSLKLAEMYRAMGNNWKAKQTLLELIARGRAPSSRLPELYCKIAMYSEKHESDKQKYFRKVIGEFTPADGFWWYYSVYLLSDCIYGNGRGGFTVEQLNKNEKASIAFLEQYIRNDALSPLWRYRYSCWIQSTRKHAAGRRKGFSTPKRTDHRRWWGK